MTESKRQKIPSGLWVVATPIGNLLDLTPRALQALEEADALLCEDTRRGQQLLSAFGIPSRELIRFDAHATDEQVHRLIARLQSGESLALVTDAGTPGMSDPGSALVAAAQRAGVTVTPVPGASAVPALLSVAGFADAAFVFRGFFPRKGGERKSELALARGSDVARTWVWFENPNRIAEALNAVAAELPDSRIVVGKELTKLHEKIFAGRTREVASEVLRELLQEGEKGEWVFAVHRASNPEQTQAADSAKSSDWVKALHCLD